MQEYRLPNGEVEREYTDEEEYGHRSQRRSIRTSQVAKLIRQTKIGRNDPCPCGSGKKFKKCCRN